MQTLQKTGHEESNYLELIGYPLGWGNREAKEADEGLAVADEDTVALTQRPQMIGSTCCPDKPRCTAIWRGDSSYLVGYTVAATSWFTPKQVGQLLSLVEIFKSNHEKLLGKETWMPDSEASCHMTGLLEFLNGGRDIEPILIELPNGTATLATKRGLISLNSNLRLNHVLFVPQLSCCLIFIV